LHQGVFLSFHSSRFLPLEGNSTPLPSQITTVESLVYYTVGMKDTQSRSRTQQMPLRLDDDERAKLEAIATMWGLSLSATIRRLIREKRVGGKREAIAAKAGEGLLSHR